MISGYDMKDARSLAISCNVATFDEVDAVSSGPRPRGAGLSVELPVAFVSFFLFGPGLDHELFEPPTTTTRAEPQKCLCLAPDRNESFISMLRGRPNA